MVREMSVKECREKLKKWWAIWGKIWYKNRLFVHRWCGRSYQIEVKDNGSSIQISWNKGDKKQNEID